jgi:hypothetical protein
MRSEIARLAILVLVVAPKLRYGKLWVSGGRGRAATVQ